MHRSTHRGVLRNTDRKGAEQAEALHRDRYGRALQLYLAEVDPISRADIVTDNTDFEHPVIVRG